MGKGTFRNVEIKGIWFDFITEIYKTRVCEN